jgi:hypothetical protein
MKIRMRPHENLKIGLCDKFRVSYTPMRPGDSVVWTVSGTSNDTGLTDSLKGMKRVRANWAIVDTPVTFTAQVSNCFGDQVSESVTITKEYKALPDIDMKATSITTTSNKKVKVQARAKFGCAGQPSQALVYNWELSPAVDIAQLQGTSSSRLIIPKGLLKASTEYKATLTVALLEDSAITSSKSATITVGSLPLVARIDGVQTAGLTEEITFGAEVDDPDDSDEEIIYSWMVQDENEAGVVTKNYTAPVFGEDSEITFNLAEFDVSAGEVYTLLLTVQRGERSAKASKKVQIVEGTPPATKIVGKDGKQAWPSFIVVKATIKSSQSGTYKWISDDFEGVTDLKTGSGSYKANMKQVANLVLDPAEIGADNLDGQEYTFTLMTIQEDGSEYTADVTLEANVAPTEGVLELDKISGTALDDEFTVSVSDGCIDDDDVTYQFGYINRQGKKIYFGEQSESEFTTKFGAGNIT